MHAAWIVMHVSWWLLVLVRLTLCWPAATPRPALVVLPRCAMIRIADGALAAHSPALSSLLDYHRWLSQTDSQPPLLLLLTLLLLLFPTRSGGLGPGGPPGGTSHHHQGRQALPAFKTKTQGLPRGSTHLQGQGPQCSAGQHAGQGRQAAGVRLQCGRTRGLIQCCWAGSCSHASCMPHAGSTMVGMQVHHH